ncbi:MAG: nucleotidyltransferase domain-containing protein [Fibrobacteraceae bacterium]|nr:nucleotidyltransferase domain-containing protein [Fibrobacteraceae bacterium]
MEKESTERFDSVLRGLADAGVLGEFILVGSWCLPVFRHVYGDPPEIPLLRTTDLDFLIRSPKRPGIKADIPGVLREMGFEPSFDAASKLIKYERPDLEIEFLVARLRSADCIIQVPKLNQEAQMLDYMEIAQQYAKPVLYKELELMVPEL